MHIQRQNPKMGTCQLLMSSLQKVYTKSRPHKSDMVHIYSDLVIIYNLIHIITCGISLTRSSCVLVSFTI